MKVPESGKAGRVEVMSGAWSAQSVIRAAVAAGREDPFYVMDLGAVVARYRRWVELMPDITPYYAVKCNDDAVLVSTLAALGASFDCASKAEIELVTSLGVTPDRIIFANPAKMSSHIRRADALGVDLMTFDSEVELLKIKHLMPHARLVVRIRCDATDAQCPLGMKFGCDPLVEAPRLLKLAAVHGINVAGVSFHAGSGAGECAVYGRGVRACAALVRAGRRLGHDMAIVDIGGGFPGNTGTDIQDVAVTVKAALEHHFPLRDVTVIAEPGRYFAASSCTLATLLHSIRELPGAEADGETHTMYFINDGVYGSFNCVLYDHQHVTAVPLEPSKAKPTACSIWGPSCDGLDCVVSHTRLPPQSVGSWLVFNDMGAYTIPIASPFNGFPVPTVKYVIDEHLWAILKDMLPLTASNFVLSSEFTPSLEFTPGDLTPFTPSPDMTPSSSPASVSPGSSSPPSPIHMTPSTPLAAYVECALK